MKYTDEVNKKYSKICLTCREVFYKKKYLAFKEWDKQKYCSLECRRSKFKKYVKPFFKYKVLFTIQCANCNKLLSVKTKYEFDRRKFCCQSCAAKYNSNLYIYWDEDRLRKQAEKQKKKVENGTWENPIYMDGILEKIAETKRENPTKFTKEMLEARSKKVAERILKSPKNIGHNRFGKWGHYFSKKNNKKVFYRSKYELKTYKLLEADNTVVSYIPEPFRIEYFLDFKRNYIPDILIKYISGKSKLVEVKPLYKIMDEVTKLKAEAAKQYCIDNNIELGYEIWTEADICPKQTSF